MKALGVNIICSSVLLLLLYFSFRKGFVYTILFYVFGILFIFMDWKIIFLLIITLAIHSVWLGSSLFIVQAFGIKKLFIQDHKLNISGQSWYLAKRLAFIHMLIIFNELLYHVYK